MGSIGAAVLGFLLTYLAKEEQETYESGLKNSTLIAHIIRNLNFLGYLTLFSVLPQAAYFDLLFGGSCSEVASDVWSCEDARPEVLEVMGAAGVGVWLVFVAKLVPRLLQLRPQWCGGLAGPGFKHEGRVMSWKDSELIKAELRKLLANDGTATIEYCPAPGKDRLGAFEPERFSVSISNLNEITDLDFEDADDALGLVVTRPGAMLKKKGVKYGHRLVEVCGRGGSGRGTPEYRCVETTAKDCGEVRERLAESLPAASKENPVRLTFVRKSPQSDDAKTGIFRMKRGQTMDLERGERGKKAPGRKKGKTGESTDLEAAENGEAGADLESNKAPTIPMGGSNKVGGETSNFLGNNHALASEQLFFFRDLRKAGTWGVIKAW